MRKKKIIIVRPRCYAGGTLVLSELCKVLRQKGYDAKIFYILREPQKDTNMKVFWRVWFNKMVRDILYPIILFFFGWMKTERIKTYRQYMWDTHPRIKTKWTPFFDKENTIVVYPEKIYGNFLHAKHVVRWLLYYNPFPDDPNAYGKDDLVIAFREVFNDKRLNPKGYVVQVNSFDTNLYRQYNFGPRKGNCYIVRKGGNRKDLPKKFDGQVIDNLPEIEKVEVFNQCEYCYSYDLQTAYSKIASLCGCKSIVVLEPGKTKEDYYSKDEIENGLLGVAYGNTPKELKRAENTRQKMIDTLDASEKNSINVDRFIDIIQKTFG